MVRWPGSYADAHGHEEISIEADGRTLALTIRGVEFTGVDFDGLEPASDTASSAEFDLAHGELTDYTLEWQMTVQVTAAGRDYAATLHCHLEFERPATENLTLSLDLDGALQVTTSQPHSYFEDALADIQRQLPLDTYLKACISCAYSDYQPGGTPLSGGLACFRDNKAGYRAVTSRHELFQVWKTKTEFVRETHLCPQYERRGPHVGYRGGFRTPKDSLAASLPAAI